MDSLAKIRTIRPQAEEIGQTSPIWTDGLNLDQIVINALIDSIKDNLANPGIYDH